MTSGNAFIFDLDGTLVDSAPGIGRALAAAFEGIGRSMPSASLRDVIGPPIRVIARRLDPTLEEEDAVRIEGLYRPLYDGSAWRETVLYPHVAETLRTLHAAGHPLCIVTNKPRIPSLAILDHLQLLPLFTEVLTRDSITPHFSTKAAMLADLLRRHSFPSATMIGDTAEDGEAAHANRLPFIHVTYGYGTAPEARNSIDDMADLLSQ